MKREQAFAELEKGKPVLFAKFMSSVAANRTFRDKETGKSRAFASIKTWVQSSGVPLQVVEYKEDDFRPESYQAPFKDGQPVCVVVETMKSESGVVILRGAIHPLDN